MPRENKRRRQERRFGKPERLADMIPVGQWNLPYWCKIEAAAQRDALARMKQDAIAAVGESKVIVADNVGEFFYADNPQEEWDFQKDFPACAPPFPDFFVEFARPSRLNSEGTLKPPEGFPDRWSWLFSASRPDEFMALARDPENRARALRDVEANLGAMVPNLDRAAVEAAARKANQHGLQAALDGIGPTERMFLLNSLSYRMLRGETDMEGMSGALEGLGWVVRATLFWGQAGRVVMPGFCTYAVTAEGVIAFRPAFGTYGLGGGDMDLAAECSGVWSAMFFPALLAISFMNCKNVTVDAVEPDQRLNRERRRAGLAPFVRYHTINIEPMRKVLAAEGGAGAHGLKRALHIARGHFATYGDTFMGRKLDAPLTVWRPAHVRGRATEGVVFSDYRVSPPKGAAS